MKTASVFTKNKRTLPALLLLLSLTFCLSGCTKKSDKVPQTGSPSETGEEKIGITASFYPLYVMLMNITEDVPNLELHLMAPPDTGCLHHYQLTPADMGLVEDTDIMVVNGAQMEEFMDKILETTDPKTVITATEGWPLLDGNPHVWVSPAGAIHQVEQIAQGLAALDPDNARLYQENAAAYTAKLQVLRDTMHTELDPLAGSSLITFHEAFPYLAQEFNLHLAGSIQREPDSEPTARELVETVALIRDLAAGGKPLALFAELDYASSAAQVIAAETGLTVHQLDPAVTGVLDKDAYIQAMEYNTEVLRQALVQ